MKKSKRGASTWNAPVSALSGPKKQVCPHGSSFPCSQCLLSTPADQAIVQKVVYDEKLGLMCDGKVVRAGLIPQETLDALKAERSMKSTRGHEGGRRDALCGSCGERGHTRKTCFRRSKLLMEAPIEKSEGELKKRRPTRCMNCHEVGHNIQTCPIKNAA